MTIHHLVAWAGYNASRPSGEVEVLVPDHTVLRRHIGQDVDISRFDGGHVHGRLLNVTRRSCWLVSDEEEDYFVPLATIAHWQAA